MFIVSLTYISEMSEVDKYLEDHIEYLNKYYELGIFIASGRKVPRTGGIILAQAENRSELETILNNDPFKIYNLANYELTEFVPSKTAPELAFLIN
ncbi:GTP cyclohydrolase [Photobacterium angustum]|uniref:YciI family protein n=1 Tax=Photobacterium angustum TaxID=661 RepID=UPI0005E08C9B|nr:YciI family protein [Photobacterium angustum]KJF92588.1 GTP cyclohydrolase [Photobacterium angustum]KJG05905.1 GTP cyclohydrolase [Photobacterium angustum]PSV92603.1 GTP cyclohydrolase [Photobacterium angustum]PSW82524.1 GTP cyclohydrolase [Photobacterium angustum]